MNEDNSYCSKISEKEHFDGNLSVCGYSKDENQIIYKKEISVFPSEERNPITENPKRENHKTKKRRKITKKKNTQKQKVSLTKDKTSTPNTKKINTNKIEKVNNNKKSLKESRIESP